jgi:hypothetical protein
VRFRRVVRGGRYVRVVDPDWSRPLEGRFAAERGGRWNPPGSFPVVYLCREDAVARAIVLRRFEGLPYSPLDLRPERRPDLVETDVPRDRFVDVVTDDGCAASGLPRTYPRGPGSREVGWDRCRPIGLAAWKQAEPGIACRSAAADGEELAWFQRGRSRLRVRRRRSFDDWFA